MAIVTVVRPEVPTTITMEMDEQEALFVLGALGRTTAITPNVYAELFDALADAGYHSDFLFAQEVDVL